MLKIKANIDLKELDEFGLEEGHELLDYDHKLYFKKINHWYWFGKKMEIIVDVNTREISIIKWTSNPKYNRWDSNIINDKKYIKKMIRAGIVEEVEK